MCYIKENTCREQSQADDQQFSFVKRSKGIEGKKIGESRAIHMAAQRTQEIASVPGATTWQKTGGLSEKKGARNNYFSSFLSKGEHSVYFPLLFLSLMSLERGMFFRQIAPMLLTETCPKSASALMMMHPKGLPKPLNIYAQDQFRVYLAWDRFIYFY